MMPTLYCFIFSVYGCVGLLDYSIPVQHIHCMFASIMIECLLRVQLLLLETFTTFKYRTIHIIHIRNNLQTKRISRNATVFDIDKIIWSSVFVTCERVCIARI